MPLRPEHVLAKPLRGNGDIVVDDAHQLRERLARPDIAGAAFNPRCELVIARTPAGTSTARSDPSSTTMIS